MDGSRPNRNGKKYECLFKECTKRYKSMQSRSNYIKNFEKNIKSPFKASRQQTWPYVMQHASMKDRLSDLEGNWFLGQQIMISILQIVDFKYISELSKEMSLEGW